jgi:hypothetical protein
MFRSMWFIECEEIRMSQPKIIHFPNPILDLGTPRNFERSYTTWLTEQRICILKYLVSETIQASNSPRTAKSPVLPQQWDTSEFREASTVTFLNLPAFSATNITFRAGFVPRNASNSDYLCAIRTRLVEFRTSFHSTRTWTTATTIH